MNTPLISTHLLKFVRPENWRLSDVNDIYQNTQDPVFIGAKNNGYVTELKHKIASYRSSSAINNYIWIYSSKQIEHENDALKKVFERYSVEDKSQLLFVFVKNNFV